MCADIKKLFPYKLLKAQEAFFDAPDGYNFDVCCYQGGFGSGKTFVGSLLGVILCYSRPGIRGLVGAQTFPLVRDTTLNDGYLKHLECVMLHSSHKFKDNFGFTYNKAEAKLVFKNGSEVLFRYLEDADKLKSLNLGFVEIEEMSDIPESTFKMLLGRLRQENANITRHRLFGHTNPESTKGWIYRYFVENAPPLEKVDYKGKIDEEVDEKEQDFYYYKTTLIRKDEVWGKEVEIPYRLIIAPSLQNIHLPAEQLAEMKSAYDPDYYKINVLGEFGDYTKGLVTKNFSDKNIRGIRYMPEQTLYITCDFNKDPMSWVLANVIFDKKNRPEKVFFFDEYVKENTDVQSAIDDLIEKYPDHKEKIILMGDASGQYTDAGSKHCYYTIMENALRKHGYKNIERRLRAGNPLIQNRIEAWNSRIRNVNDEVNLFIDPKCEKLLYNIHNLKYRPGTSRIDLPSEDKLRKDRESKFLGHIFDAASYLIEYFWPIVSVLAR